MIKKLLISIVLGMLIFGSIGIYSVLKTREQIRLAKLAKEAEKAQETKITLIEGWTLNDITEYLDKSGLVSKADFSTALKNFNTSNYPLINTKPKTAGLEGFLFPDTYLVAKDLAIQESLSNIIIKKLLKNFEIKFTPEMVAQAGMKKMSIFEIITLASIVEKESGRNQEDRLLIAGVFYNRLKAGVALQSDATVNYITNKKTPSISLADTELDSPYNTYKYKGLPPGPISNPGLNSVMAALYPKETDYFYFLTNPENNRAIFSKTFEEHIQNKQKYLR